MTKRICLFAGFHPNNQISDYVVYYLKALSKLADVYYMADCTMPQSELDKLVPYTKGVWAKRHGKYDFGSWQEIIHQIGWDRLRSYDECIFANDSVFAPLFPLELLIEKGTAICADAWAFNAYEYEHLEAYFYVLKKRVFSSATFENFIESITKLGTVNDVIIQYEQGLTKMLREGGFTYQVFISFCGSAADEWRNCIRAGLPILKTKVFTKYRTYVEHESLFGWQKFLMQHTKYPVKLIEQHLVSVGIDPNQFNTWGFRLKSVWWTLRRWRQKCFRIHFHKHERILVLFGVSLWNNEAKFPTRFPVKIIQ